MAVCLPVSSSISINKSTEKSRKENKKERTAQADKAANLFSFLNKDKKNRNIFGFFLPRNNNTSPTVRKQEISLFLFFAED